MRQSCHLDSQGFEDLRQIHRRRFSLKVRVRRDNHFLNFPHLQSRNELRNGEILWTNTLKG